MQEVIKQPQYQPLPVEKQVAIIYAVNNGYLDDVPVERVREWETGFHEFMDLQNPQILQGIREGKVLTDELTQGLVAAIQAYKQTVSA